MKTFKDMLSRWHLAGIEIEQDALSVDRRSAALTANTRVSAPSAAVLVQVLRMDFQKDSTVEVNDAGFGAVVDVESGISDDGWVAPCNTRQRKRSDSMTIHRLGSNNLAVLDYKEVVRHRMQVSPTFSNRHQSVNQAVNPPGTL